MCPLSNVKTVMGSAGSARVVSLQTAQAVWERVSASVGCFFRSRCPDCGVCVPPQELLLESHAITVMLSFHTHMVKKKCTRCQVDVQHCIISLLLDMKLSSDVERGVPGARTSSETAISPERMLLEIRNYASAIVDERSSVSSLNGMECHCE